MFSLEQLHGFVAVAEELHFGRAAERLAMTQPPLSRRIQQLEREVGAELFVRSHRRVALTAAGQAFLVDARRLLHLADEAAANARRAPHGDVGTVTVGFTAATAYGYLGGLLDRAARALPKVDVRLREMVTATQVEALHDGTIDIGLVRPPVREPDLASRLIAVEPMLAALPSAHPRARPRARLELGHFDDMPLVMYEPAGAAYFHDLLRGAFAAARVQPQYRQFVTQVHTALALVQAGVGWTLVPAAARSLHFSGIALRQVRGLEAFPAETSAAWRRDRANPARDSLLKLIRPASRSDR
jgi:DNA-binding transcriptional LysR family regulator